MVFRQAPLAERDANNARLITAAIFATINSRPSPRSRQMLLPRDCRPRRFLARCTARLAGLNSAGIRFHGEGGDGRDPADASVAVVAFFARAGMANPDRGRLRSQLLVTGVD